MGAGSRDAPFTLNSGAEDQLIARGFKRNRAKTAFTWILTLLSGGILRLVFYWMDHWLLICTHSPCRPEDADQILLEDQFKQKFVCKVVTLTNEDSGRTGKHQSHSLGDDRGRPAPAIGFPEKNGYFRDVDRLRYFDDRKLRYIWNEETKGFQKLLGMDQDLDTEFLQTGQPLDEPESFRRRALYRPNIISISITPIIELLVKEVLNPFYIFQIFSICLWCSYGYYYYAGAIFLTTSGSLTLTVYETRKMQQTLRDRVHGQELVEVCRPGGVTEVISSELLVPGDVFIIPTQGCQVMCDAVLIAGTVIVNEAALTGESVPVTRFYANEPVKAVVLRTGFTTSKGTLIRSIMFPKPVDFKFYRHTYIFVIVLSGIALCGMIYSAILRAMRGQDVSEIIIRSLDVITIAVPPALPAALSVGIVYAQRRLKKAQIYCLSPRAINICGSINLVCFDKTGTLTVDGLDLKCVLPCDQSDFQAEVTDPKTLPNSTLKHCMAACHSLTMIQEKLSGDPVDLIMFNAVGFALEEPGISEPTRFDLVAPTVVTDSHGTESGEAESIGIIRDFPFASNLQRMSTIVRRLGDPHFAYFVKGAPEKLVTLCRPDTVPEDFVEKLESFTRRGDRVLAVAWKSLEDMKLVQIHKVQREELDCNLLFVGFVVMENRLKVDTNAVLDEIHKAEIRVVMVTGDNIYTAISVARESGMVKLWDDVQVVNGGASTVTWSHSESISVGSNHDGLFDPSPKTHPTVVKLPTNHLAISGDSFLAVKNHHPEVLKKLLAQGTIFARMSPTDKERLVEEFQKAGFYVAMCGDGANDCGALKAAHAGVSLSESEAAAAAPFTSTAASIRCVPEIIKEGRAALVTSFGIFKYMAGYSLTQFFTVILLYSIATNFSDLQFLYTDIFQVLILSATFGRSKAHERLAKIPPPTSLMAFIPLFSVFSQVVIVMGAQLAAFFVAYTEKDATSYENMYPNGTGTPPFASKENFAVFSVSAFQYVWLAIAFSKGPPYRRILLKNKLFCICAMAMVAFDLFLLLGPTAPVKWLLELLVPENWNKRLILLSIAVCNGALAISFEGVIVDYVIYQKLGKKFRWLRNSKRHQDVTQELLLDLRDDWWAAKEQHGGAISTFTSAASVIPPPPPPPSPPPPPRKSEGSSYANKAFVGDSDSMDTHL
ncbi:putative cation-transporting ATPase 13A3 [Hypsibius exemplaris]|uniref:Cation-transporting ATPase n=1 Tax=Hypsibius exemplaris TaxID=2072580 RepID=A0A1W0WP38_HYPEX|nr:putative cation-transporting ATPase 13A3 [Hypsibius exemplaris]